MRPERANSCCHASFATEKFTSVVEPVGPHAFVVLEVKLEVKQSLPQGENVSGLMVQEKAFVADSSTSATFSRFHGERLSPHRTTHVDQISHKPQTPRYGFCLTLIKMITIW